MRRWPVYLLFGVLSCVSGRARADTATEAQLQYDLGAELYSQGKYTEAVQHFIASHRLVPNANVVLNIVQTFLFLDRYTEAYNWNEEYISLKGVENGRLRRAELEPKVAAIDVSSVPPGAEIFVDRVDLGSVGTTPRRVAVEPGSHSLILRKSGYEDLSAAVEAKVGAVAPTPVTLKPLIGRLIVDSVPSGAEVRTPDGTKLGVTPLVLDLPVGSHRIELRRPGYLARSRTARIAAGEEARLKVNLERDRSRISVLTVQGNTARASVFVDERGIGEAPLTTDLVTPGRRRIRVEAPGREPWTDSIILEPGAATRVDYDLVERGAGPWPGWSYLGYGVGGSLLVAGAVTGLLALDAKSDFNEEPSREKLDRLDSRNLATDVLLGSAVLTLGATLTWDLLKPAPPKSSGRVELER